MSKFYSASTRGFYDTAIHGAPTLLVIDPAWTHPTVKVADPAWSPADHEEGAMPTMIDILDPDVVAPTIEVANPDCLIPADAVEIAEADHAALLLAQTQGKIISSDANGQPIAIDPPPPSPEELMALLRAHRDRLLAASDIMVMPDRWEAYTADQRAAWAAYRQALRDIPETMVDPANPVWPAAPGA